MKKVIFIFTSVFFLLSAAVIFAQQSDVVYVDGWVDIRTASGERYELMTGDIVYNGDTIITEEDGVAELEPENGSRIIISPGTVFSVKQANINGKKHSIMSVTYGEVSFKFNKMTQEPMISTPSSLMGVRGTEFTVYSGSDGSSQVIVESGAVEVSGKGESTLLSKNEGVEIPVNSVPGRKFETKGKEIDFSEWNNSIIEGMMSSPLRSLDLLGSQLSEFSRSAIEWEKKHEELSLKLEELRAERKSLFDKGRDDEARSLHNEKIRPMEIDSLKCVMNYRYYALSAMSFRQHIIGGFYVRMKTAYINDTCNGVYREFMARYKSLISGYHKQITPLLVEADY